MVLRQILEASFELLRFRLMLDDLELLTFPFFLDLFVEPFLELKVVSNPSQVLF